MEVREMKIDDKNCKNIFIPCFHRDDLGSVKDGQGLQRIWGRTTRTRTPRRKAARLILVDAGFEAIYCSRSRAQRQQTPCRKVCNDISREISLGSSSLMMTHLS